METVVLFAAHQVISRSEFRSPSMSPAKVKYDCQISGSPSGVELFDFFQESTNVPQSVSNRDEDSFGSPFSNSGFGSLAGSDWSSENHTAQKLDFESPLVDAAVSFKLGEKGIHVLPINHIPDDFETPKCDKIERPEEMQAGNAWN